MRLAQFLACSLCTSHALVLPPAVARLASTPAAARSRAVVSSEEGSEEDSTVNVGSLIGYTLLLGYLSPIFTTAAAKAGLWNPPPVNTFTAIANNAADEAMASGTLQLGNFLGYPIQTGTWYAQDIWRDFIVQYYANGETTAFLTKAGGICEQHAAWCAGVDIPPGSTGSW